MSVAVSVETGKNYSVSLKCFFKTKLCDTGPKKQNKKPVVKVSCQLRGLVFRQLSIFSAQQHFVK